MAVPITQIRNLNLYICMTSGKMTGSVFLTLVTDGTNRVCQGVTCYTE